MKIKYVVVEETEAISLLMVSKIVSGLNIKDGRVVIARYGVNKSELKKVAKIEDAK